MHVVSCTSIIFLFSWIKNPGAIQKLRFYRFYFAWFFWVILWKSIKQFFYNTTIFYVSTMYNICVHCANKIIVNKSNAPVRRVWTFHSKLRKQWYSLFRIIFNEAFLCQMSHILRKFLRIFVWSIFMYILENVHAKCQLNCLDPDENKSFFDIF